MKRSFPILLTVCLVSLSAWAYILPGGSILRRAAGKRDDLQLSTLKVKGSMHLNAEAAVAAATALGVEAPAQGLTLDAKLWMKLPGRCRLEVTSNGSTKSIAQIRSGSRSRNEGANVAAMAIAVDSACAVLAIRSSAEDEAREALDRVISNYKIEFKKTSLARLGGQVAYVLGDSTEQGASLWIYKDSFLPARLRYKDGSGVKWDIRMVGYSSPGTGEAFPRQLEVWKNGTLLLQLTATDGETSVSIDDRLM